MSDFNVSISQLIEGRSGDKEKFRVWDQLRTQALLRFETSATGTSDGAGTWLTLWSGVVPTNSSVMAKAAIIGRASAKGAAYEVAAAAQDFGGVTSLVGGGYTTIVSLEDAITMDARWSLTGSTLALQVRDDATQAMAWRAFVSAVTTT